jgi:hypothetical protein
MACFLFKVCSDRSPRLSRRRWPASKRASLGDRDRLRGGDVALYFVNSSADETPQRPQYRELFTPPTASLGQPWRIQPSSLTSPAHVARHLAVSRHEHDEIHRAGSPQSKRW